MQASTAAVQGIFRRRIRLVQQAQQVIGAVEDDFHAFVVIVTHDGTTVTGLDARAIRYPLTICSSAIEPLRVLSGVPLSPESRLLGSFADAHSHCTHLFDLAGLSIAHACRNEQQRQYDISIPDPESGRTHALLMVNGQERLRFQVSAEVIEAPIPFTGQNLGKGFSRWAQANLADLELREAALVLQRGWFVSNGRRHREQISHATGAWSEIPPGACYSHQPERIGKAARIHSYRDFTQDESALLAFLDRVSILQ